MQPVSRTGHEFCDHSVCEGQLEFVQILVIVVVMMVMVVVITCLLNHYRLSAYSLLTRHSAARRQHLPFTSDTSLWPSDGVGPSSGASEQQVSGSRPPDPVGSRGGGAGGGVGVGAGRFQPTWPYLQHSIIELPPTISLSDGEEPPPYQGPCTLQLRDPEQQLELNPEVGRPPASTISGPGPLMGPLPPSTYSSSSSSAGSGSGSISISVGGYPNQPRQEGAPPTYSEAVGHYYHPSPPRHLRTGGGNPTPLIQVVENRNARNKEKQKGQQV
ncbi:protein TMEPAI-like [Alosa alosa]|uniref:protein TMEPAI-like n=1 Tax=Alosa alosa TaxID=278164 RepID=UPI002015197D|nr:protein TMEPAI-like [Alosa alosa]